MTLYTYDTEFLEDGSTIELISIGIIADDGREYYAVNANMPVQRIVGSQEGAWLRANVWPSLPLNYPDLTLDYSSLQVRPRKRIAKEVAAFLLAGETPPELWAYYSAYDHVALNQLWGPMISHPEGIPMWTNDIMQVLAPFRCERPTSAEMLPKQEEGTLHNALQDARWNMDMVNALREHGVIR